MLERQAPADPAWQLDAGEWYTNPEGLSSWPLSASTGEGGDDDGCGGGSGGDSEASATDLLLMELAETGREVTDAELRRIREHVAGAGFAPGRRTKPGRRGVGKVFDGRELSSLDRLAAGEAHYVWHVLHSREWPEGTSYSDYIRSLSEVVRDPAAAVALTRHNNLLQASFLRRSGNLRGLGGHEWVLVEYRPVPGHVVTAYQPRPETYRELERRVIRWLQTPQW